MIEINIEFDPLDCLLSPRDAVAGIGDNVGEPDVYTIFIAPTDVRNHGGFLGARSFYAWAVYGRDQKEICRSPSMLGGSLAGDHTGAVFPALREALSYMSNNSTVHVITGLKFFADHLKTPAEERRQNKYKAGGGKKLLAHADALRKLDDEVQAQRVVISGKHENLTPWEEQCLNGVKAQARVELQNFGNEPGSHGL